eukprot:5324638-Pleurochrysis_carterae.AAC.2
MKRRIGFLVIRHHCVERASRHIRLEVDLLVWPFSTTRTGSYAHMRASAQTGRRALRERRRQIRAHAL